MTLIQSKTSWPSNVRKWQTQLANWQTQLPNCKTWDRTHHWQLTSEWKTQLPNWQLKTGLRTLQQRYRRSQLKISAENPAAECQLQNMSCDNWQLVTFVSIYIATILQLKHVFSLLSFLFSVTLCQTENPAVPPEGIGQCVQRRT